jgi:hypothetical protein
MKGLIITVLIFSFAVFSKAEEANLDGCIGAFGLSATSAVNSAFDLWEEVC